MKSAMFEYSERIVVAAGIMRIVGEILEGTCTKGAAVIRLNSAVEFIERSMPKESRNVLKGIAKKQKYKARKIV